MEESCLSCYHFPVCRVNDKARKEEIWNKDAKEFYREEAESCDFYTPTSEAELEKEVKKC